MSISPVSSSLSSVVNMINSRSYAAVEAKQNVIERMTAAVKKKEVPPPETEETAVPQEEALTPAEAYKQYMQSPEGMQKAIAGDVIGANTVLSILQNLADKVDLAILVENVVEAGNADPQIQKRNEQAFALLTKNGTYEPWFIGLNLWKGLATAGTAEDDRVTDGAIGRATGNLMQDILAMDFGFSHLENTSAKELKGTILNAMNRVADRINQSQWKTDFTYVPLSEEELRLMAEGTVESVKSPTSLANYTLTMTVEDTSYSLEDVLSGKIDLTDHITDLPRISPAWDKVIAENPSLQQKISYYQLMRDLGYGEGTSFLGYA